MKSNLIFNQLEYVELLKKSGILPEHAIAITNATASAFSQLMVTQDLTTKTDLITLKLELQAFIVKAVTTSIVILSALQTLFHFLQSMTT